MMHLHRLFRECPVGFRSDAACRSPIIGWPGCRFIGSSTHRGAKGSGQEFPEGRGFSVRSGSSKPSSKKPADVAFDDELSGAAPLPSNIAPRGSSRTTHRDERPGSAAPVPRNGGYQSASGHRPVLDDTDPTMPAGGSRTTRFFRSMRASIAYRKRSAEGDRNSRRCNCLIRSKTQALEGDLAGDIDDAPGMDIVLFARLRLGNRLDKGESFGDDRLDDDRPDIARCFSIGYLDRSLDLDGPSKPSMRWIVNPSTRNAASESAKKNARDRMIHAWLDIAPPHHTSRSTVCR